MSFRTPDGEVEGATRDGAPTAEPRSRSRRARPASSEGGDAPRHAKARARAAALGQLGGRSIVLVGMMGVGKTTVGRRLAARLGLGFADADAEIELAAGRTIPEIFAEHGEPYFRDGERRVIARLLAGPQIVLATGGGAFLDPRTRAAVAEHGVAVWLQADAATLMPRLRRRSNRPLLRTADPEGTVRALIAAREPFYALADLAVPSRNLPHERMVDGILDALAASRPRPRSDARAARDEDARVALGPAPNDAARSGSLAAE